MCFGGGGSGSSSTPALAPITIPTPTGSSSQGTGALPTVGQLSGSGPLPYQDFGSTPDVTAATIAAPTTTAPTVDPNSALTSGLTQFENANASALAPSFQAQDMSLQDNLAGRGIVNSGAATYLQQNLDQGQASTLAAADAPIIQGAQTAYNTDTLANQASELTTNSGNQQAELAASGANQTAINDASGLNAGYYNEAVTGDENSYNNYQNELEQQGTTYGEGLLSGFLGSYGSANPTTLGSIAGSPAAITNAGNAAVQNTPNYGGAFSSAFSSLSGSPAPSSGGGGSGTSSYDEGAYDELNTTPGASAAGNFAQ